MPSVPNRAFSSAASASSRRFSAIFKSCVDSSYSCSARRVAAAICTYSLSRCVRCERMRAICPGHISKLEPIDRHFLRTSASMSAVTLGLGWYLGMTNSEPVASGAAAEAGAGLSVFAG